MAFITCGDDEVFDWSVQVGAGGSAPIEQQPPQRQQQQPTLRCPRCDSSNTKFCYYNNYSRSQPRHFCRACRRHWTAGGTLRSVPVGGARKNNNNKTTTTTTTTACNTNNTAQPATTPYNAGGNTEESSIYPDQAMMFYNAPPPTSSDQGSTICSYAGSLQSPALGVVTNDQGIIINPLPVSAACSLTGGDTASLLDLMPGSSAGGTWMQDPSTLSANYYNWTWLDDTLDFVNSPGPEHYPAAADYQLGPVMD